jgi:hypothetical protein
MLRDRQPLVVAVALLLVVRLITLDRGRWGACNASNSIVRADLRERS